jgi:hypothetical protein
MRLISSFQAAEYAGGDNHGDAGAFLPAQVLAQQA